MRRIDLFRFAFAQIIVAASLLIPSAWASPRHSVSNTQERECVQNVDSGGQTRFSIPAINDQLLPNIAENNLSAAELNADPPLLHSNPSATQKIYLNFSGCAARQWGSWSNAYSPAYDTNGDASTFSPAEEANITAIWNRVAEDMRPFNLDVTTERPSTIAAKAAVEVCIGGSYGLWYGSSAGGVAYLYTWGSTNDGRVWVFEDNLGNGNPKYVGEAVSHETGHAFGLSHHPEYSGTCTYVDDYYNGSGSGETGWAPIMGVGYYQEQTRWSLRSQITACVGAGSQDDLAVIVQPYNAISYRADDYADTYPQASPLTVVGTAVSAAGTVGDPGDLDFFSFTTGSGTITLRADNFETGPNLDVALSLYDTNGQIVASADPSTDTDASLTFAATEGTYYLAVGSTNWYGSLGAYTVTGTIFAPTIPVDSTRPTATLESAAGISAATSAAHPVSIRVSDNAAVSITSFGDNDILVTGPNGFNRAGRFSAVNIASNGTPRIATYLVDPPAGGWVRGANGIYSIAVAGSQILDTSGNSVAAGALGTFTVAVPSPDSDGDGLDDDTEALLGTDPLAPDTDGDGVDDGQEVTDGSDPLDPGSALPRLGTTACGEWNGFFGMYNFFENVNRSAQQRSLTIVLYAVDGEIRSTRNFVLAPGAQYDYPVHELPGFTRDSYGLICITHDGSEGDVDSRMLHYLPDQSSGFQYAFAMPSTNGLQGEQVVAFNTFQPSLDPADAEDFVANWIQIINLSSTPATGRLLFYTMAGAVLGDPSGELVTLAAGARADFSAHRFGKNIVGTVVWKPSNNAQRFILRDVRYLYDNSQLAPSFHTAFQLEGSYGTSKRIVAPLDTNGGSSILEIINSSSTATNATVEIFRPTGELVRTIQLNAAQLPPHGAFHIIIDPILGTDQLGVAAISGAPANSIVAIAMQYRRNASGGIEYMYGIPAKEALGVAPSGSYNTFIGQTSRLLMLNPTGSAQSVQLSMTRSDGTLVLSGENRSIPAHGRLDLALNTFEQIDKYGVVRVVSAGSPILNWVIRERGADYAMPTPCRE